MKQCIVCRLEYPHEIDGIPRFWFVYADSDTPICISCGEGRKLVCEACLQTMPIDAVEPPSYFCTCG